MKAMRSKQKKNEVEEDDLVFEDYDDDELDEELKLPKSMDDISREEKQELLLFKRQHTEREWEEEISRRAAIYERKLDYERLRRMTGATTAATDTTKAKRAAPKRGQKTVMEEESQDEEDDKEEEEDEEDSDDDHMIADEGDEYPSEKSSASDEDDDDLFDSDEEAEISNRGRVAAQEDLNRASSSSKVLGKRKTTTQNQKNKNKTSSSRRRQRWTSDSEAEEEEEEEEGSHDEDDEEDDDRLMGGEGESDRHDYNLKSIKDSHRRAVDRDGAVSSSSHANRQSSAASKVFDNLSEWKAHLEKELQRELPVKPNDHLPADHDDYRKLFRRRDDLIRTLHEPFFEQLVVGCFVRYLIGVTDSDTDHSHHNNRPRQVYRMCEVIGVDRSKKVYRLPPTGSGLSTETNVRLHLNNAGETKLFQKLDKVSNHSLTDAEIDFHLNGVISRPEKRLPTKRDFRQLRQRHKQFSEHVYTHEDIAHMVSSRAGLNKLLTTEYSTAMAALQKRLDEAVEKGDVERQELLRKEIRKLEEINERQRLVFQAHAKKQTDINRRMRESNVVRDMDAGMRKRHEELEAISKGVLPNAISDPFIRRETRPKILWNTSEKLKQKKLEETDKPAQQTAPNTNTTTTTNNATKTSTSSDQRSHKKARYHQGEEDRWAVSADLSFSEVRRRIAQRLGVDPFAASQVTPRDRYLQRVCGHLPPPGSVERERLRGSNKSLQDYILLLSKNGDVAGGGGAGHGGEPLQT